MAVLRNLIDRGSLIREVADFPAGVADDGVIGFTINSKKYVRSKRGGKFKSEEIGIWADGSDMTARLQSRFNHAAVKEIEMDANGGGDIVVNGTLNIPAGKILRFVDGTRLVGTGSITGGIIDASDSSSIFANTLTVLPEGSSKGYFSDAWFSITANGTAIDSTGVQKAVNASAYSATYTRRQAFLKFRPNTYVVAKINIADNITLLGSEHGPTNWVMDTTQTGASVIMLNRSGSPSPLYNAKVVNINFDGKKDTTFTPSAYGIYVDPNGISFANPTEKVSIIGCTFKNFNFPIVIIRPNKNCAIHSCEFYDNKNGCILTADNNKIDITYNKFYNTEGSVCEVRDIYGNPSKFVNFSYNYGEQFLKQGIHFSNVGGLGHDHAKIHKNDFIGQGTPFGTDPGEFGTADVISCYDFRNATITENYVWGSGDMGITLDVNCVNVIAANNRCVECGSCGLITHGGLNIQITGNIFIDNGKNLGANGTVQGGIAVEKNYISGQRGKNIIISGNVCADTKAVRTQIYDIWIGSSDVTIGQNEAKTYFFHSTSKVRASNIDIYYEIDYTKLISNNTQINLYGPLTNASFPPGTVLKKVLVSKEVAFVGVTNPRMDITVDPPPNYEEIIRQFSLATTGVVGDKVSELGIEMDPAHWRQGGSSAFFAAGGKMNIRLLADSTWGDGTITNLTAGKVIVKCLCDFNMF